ncbi:concanavalin A-like lectin/glucanase [Aureococcus anophagefferens]|nr:concanavalin A-like lectin/glucanase [Aureococcus anophagefferens]
MVLSLTRVALALLQRTTMVQSLTRVALALLWLRSEAVPARPTLTAPPSAYPTATRRRRARGALSFDGTDDYVEFPSAVTADIRGSNSRTICLWAVIDEWDEGALFSHGSGADGMEFGIMAKTSGSIQVQLHGGSYDMAVALSGSDDGDWHHYCLAYDGSWTLYFDGASAYTYSVALDTGSDYALTLGDRTDRNGNHLFSGSIDEVYVYSSALNTGSIEVLYNAVTPQPTVTPRPTHVSLSTLVARYSFDDGTAAEDGDSSLDGTIAFYYGATATTGRDGSGALSFDGTDDYVEFPSAVTADIQGSNARTICLWAVIDSFSSDGGLFDYGTSSDLQNFALRVAGTDGTLKVQLWGADTDVALSGSDDSGWHHYCLTYDGSAWYLYFDGNEAGSNARTICLWAVIDSFSSDGGLFDYGTSSDLQNFALRVAGTDGSLKVQLWGADTDVALSGSDDGGWHHYCLTYDGSDWALYFDGSQAATGTDAVNTGSDRALRLGQFWNDYFFDGSIDEVYVYSSALDAASIQVLYDAVTPQPTVTPLPTHVSHSTLVAHYRFDKVLATEDGDSSLDGRIHGAAATTGLFGSYALSFDGTDDYVEFPSAVTADIQGSNARTICLWAVIDSFSSDGGLFDYGTSSDLQNFALRGGTDGSLKVQLWGADTDVALSGVWHGAVNTGSDRALRLGQWNLGDDNEGYLDGSIDEVYVYSSALDAASIQVLYDAVTAAPTVTPLPTRVSHSTLVARYRFDKVLATEDGDSSLDGTINGAAATTGLFGSYALSFDGTDDYVEFPSAVTADIQGSNARTICLWAVIDSFSSDGGLFDYGSYSDYENFALRVHGTSASLKVQLFAADTDVALSGSDDGGWHHYCLTYDGSDWVLYFDGSQAATATVAVNTGSDTALRLGRWAGGDYLDGSIDEVYRRRGGRVSHSTLVARYSFDDGTAAEDGDSSLDGTINGATATTGRDGSGALSFDGTDDYVEFPSAVTADIQGSSSRTVCLWALIDDFSGEAGLFDYGAYSDLANFALRVAGTDGTLKVQLWGADTDVALSGSDDGGWHHYCLTYDGSAWYLYFDGNEAAYGTSALDTGSDLALRIGAWGYSGYFDGSIDEVYIYSSALDAASIQVLYDVVTPQPTVTPRPTHVSHSTLVARYSFDDGTAADDSDSSLDGTINGATATAVEPRSDNDGYLDGSIDEVYVYSSALDAASIQVLYDAVSTAPTNFALRVAGTDGSLKVQLWAADTDVALSGSDDGDWHHYCVTYDGSAWYLYFDGNEAGSGTSAVNTGSDRALKLGMWDLSSYLDGAIDETTVPTPNFFQATLVAHYSFDARVRCADDHVGDGSLDCTRSGTKAVKGRDGSGALSFDGTDDYVEFPSAVTADIQGSNARTVCLWAVINSFSSDGSEYDLGAGLFDYGDYSDLENFALRVHGTDGSLRVQLWGADTDVALSGSDDGDWHHYCLTYDGSDWALYFDGTQAATGTEALDTGSDNALRLGQFWNDYFFDGSIDEVYVYASALDAASIQVLYDAVTAAPTATPTAIPSATPSATPSSLPSSSPSSTPSAAPSPSPSAAPSSSPSSAPSAAPSPSPSAAPSSSPSSAPSAAPSPSPSAAPSSSRARRRPPRLRPLGAAPSPFPSSAPSAAPSPSPSAAPSSFPSSAPSAAPSPSPSPAPSSFRALRRPRRRRRPERLAERRTVAPAVRGAVGVPERLAERSSDDHPDGNVVQTADILDNDGQVTQVVSGDATTADILDNDGQVTQVVSGDATVSEYTLTLTCDGDASVTDSIDFQHGAVPIPERDAVRRSVAFAKRGAVPIPSSTPSATPSASPSATPSAPPSPSPSALPTIVPTASFLQISSIGTGSTCVHDVECELLWVYRGDSSACATLTAVFTDPGGNVVQAADILDNDGQVTQVVSGDSTVNEYTLTLTCDGDASVTDSIDFQVSYTPAPTMVPSSSWPSAVPSALPSTGPSPSPSTAPSPSPTTMVPTTRAPSTNVATTASPTTRAPSTNVETTASPTTRARSFLPTLYPTIVATTGDTFEVNGSATFAGMTAEGAAANEGVFRVALADVAGVENDDSLALEFSSGTRRRLDEASSSFEMIYTVAVAENAAAESVASNIDAVTIDSMDSAIAAAAESADLAAAFRNHHDSRLGGHYPRLRSGLRRRRLPRR